MMRPAAEIIGRYFSHLFDQSPPCTVQDSREKWRSKHKHKLNRLMRPCTSEELLKWKLDTSNVTVLRVGQRMLPFQRSLRVRTTGTLRFACTNIARARIRRCQAKASSCVPANIFKRSCDVKRGGAVEVLRCRRGAIEEPEREEAVAGSCAAEAPPRQDGDIVLAHCNKSVEWLGDAVRGLREAGAEVTHVHIVSKCGSTPTTTSLRGLAGLVINMTTRRNVGRMRLSRGSSPI
eukprot:scaffold37838_cov58-Phaeocystis_antarctica.AAC.4